MSCNDDYLREYKERRERERSEAKGNLSAMCGRLVQLGVSWVEISYDGQGDEGGVEDVRYFSGNDEEMRSAIPGDITESLTQVADTLAPDGYENNDGGYGTFTIYVGERKAELVHNQRYMEVSTDTVEWSL